MPEALTTLVMALPLLPGGKLPAQTEPEEKEEEPPVRARAYFSPGEAQPGQKVQLVVRLDIRKGWHVNARKPREEYLIPTEVRVESPAGDLLAGEPDYPEEKLVTLGFSDAPLAVYDGRTEIPVPFTVAKIAQLGLRTLTAHVRYQACDDKRCLAPEELTLSAELKIANAD
jgi:DsbC/DsbD-like thiol-disulfide interchange protein